MTPSDFRETFRPRCALSEESTERRAHCWFPIVREVRYKVLNSKCSIEIGTGETINISSAGVLFDAQVPLPPGKRIEVSISWPAKLDGTCGLRLVARGRIVRCQGRSTAVEVDKYEFRTASLKLSARAEIPALADREIPPAKDARQVNRGPQ